MDFPKLTPQEILTLGQPSEEFKDQILQHYKPSQLNWSNSSEAITILRHSIKAIEASDTPSPNTCEEEIPFQTRDNVTLPIQIWRPAEETLKPPVIILYHAGGFIMGSPRSLSSLAKALVHRFQAIVLAPTYRLAPEHPFPTAFNDAYDAFTYILANFKTALHTDLSNGFVIGGISSGGNLANAVAHLARDAQTEPHITGLWLSCAGVRLAPDRTHLLDEKYRERLLSRTQDECVYSIVKSPEFSTLMKSCFKPDENSALFAPLIWSDSAGHQGLPKMYSQVCGMDTARDEVLIFDDMLKCEGIATRCDIYSGLPHVFWHSFKRLSQSQGWLEDTLAGFEWLLNICP